MNDLSYGHVGRVSYKPSDDQEADIGDLNLNRITEQRESRRATTAAIRASTISMLIPHSTVLPGGFAVRGMDTSLENKSSSTF